jgi:hypothetical protein
MKSVFKFLSVSAAFLCCTNGYAEVSFYCALPDNITIAKQDSGMWPYLYTALETPFNSGIQPALSGWGDAVEKGPFFSAVWTDGALACNYNGKNSQSQTEVMVLMSKPLGVSPTCHFPANGDKTFCDSDDPGKCQLVCK